MITLDVTFHRRLVRASVGDLVRVDLPEDAAAGSRWLVSEALPVELRLVKDKTASGPASSGRERRLEFRVARSGCFRLCLVCARAWQQGDANFEVYVDARAPDSGETRLDAPPPSSRRANELTAALHGRNA